MAEGSAGPGAEQYSVGGVKRAERDYHASRSAADGGDGISWCCGGGRVVVVVVSVLEVGSSLLIDANARALHCFTRRTVHHFFNPPTTIHFRNIHQSYSDLSNNSYRHI